MYKFTVTIDGDEYDISPINDLSLNTTLEDLTYKKELGTIELTGADYDLLLPFAYLSVPLVVKRMISPLSGTEIFSGILEFTDYDTRLKVLYCKPSETNLKEVLDGNSSKMINIFDANIEIDIFAARSGGSTPANPDDYHYYEEPITDTYGVPVDVWIAYKSKYPLAGFSYNEYNGFYYWPYTGGPFPTFIINTTASPAPSGYRYVGFIGGGALGQYCWVEIDSLALPSGYGGEFEYPVSSGNYFGNNVSLRAVVGQGLAAAGIFTEFVSSTLFADAPETGNTFAGVGSFEPDFIYLKSISDAKNPTALQPATVCNITMSAILATFKALNFYYFFDINGKFRIEHVSYADYYNSGAAIDLTTMTSNGLTVAEKLYKVSLIKDHNEKTITLKPVAATTDIYKEMTLTYTDSSADAKKSKDAAIDTIVFDFPGCVNDTEDIFANSGICMVTIETTPTPYFINFLYSEYILKNFYKHLSNFDTFVVDGDTVEAETIWPKAKLSEINMPTVKLSSRVFEANRKYKTFFELTPGDLGSVDSATEFLNGSNKGNLKLNLHY